MLSPEDRRPTRLPVVGERHPEQLSSRLKRLGWVLVVCLLPGSMLGCPGNDSPFGIDAGRTDVVLPRDTPLTCQIGTPDNCAACGAPCPGVDNHTMSRSCLGGRCALGCRASWYDVNGDPQDGCEVQDDEPAHDTRQTALDLNAILNNGGVINDNALAQTVDFPRMPSDDQEHLDPPVGMRPNGRPDWFKMTVMDIAFSGLDGDVVVDISKFPASARFRVTVLLHCEEGSDIGEATEEGNGGGTIMVSASSTDCPGWSDDGDYIVSVTKIAGAHSAAQYTLSIEP